MRKDKGDNMTIRKKNKFKWGLIITSFVLSLIMFASTLIGFFAPEKNEHKLDRFDFEYGKIADYFDEPLDSRTTLVSKKSYKTTNVDIEILDPSVEVSVVGCYMLDTFEGYITNEFTVNDWYLGLSSDGNIVEEVRIMLKFKEVDGEYPQLNFFNIGKLFDSVVIKAY